MTWAQVAKLFEELELRLIASLKRNLAAHKEWEKKEGFQWPAWQAEKLKHMANYRKQNDAIMAEYQPVIDEYTAELLKEQFEEGKQNELNPPKENTISDEHFFGINKPRMDALVDETRQKMRTAESSTLRLMDDVYRQTIFRAEIAAASGAVTRNQAIDMAIKDFLAAGITSIEYKNGRRVNIASYAEMALRTASTRSAQLGAAEERMKLGIDTVYVSQYGACSKTCLPWQGRVYIDDVWGVFTSPTQGDRGLSNDGHWYPLLSVAIKNGLFHPNCRHTMVTWKIGDSIPPRMDGEKVRENAKLEEKQRALERKIRKYKRMAEGYVEPELVKTFKRKTAEAQKELREFIAEHNDRLRRDYWREKTHDVPLNPGQKDDIIYNEIKKDARIRGVLHLDPTPINIDSLSFDDEHINMERGHNVTAEQAKDFIRNARASVTVWDGKFERYYSDNGASYVDIKNNKIRTVFSVNEFDEKMKNILEVLKKYGK